MPDLSTLLAFAAVSLGMVLTPGPNMIYLVSRSVAQGSRAGLISLGGVILGFVIWMLLAAFGVTAMLLVVPYAYDTLRIAGALYLGWLAFEAIRPGGASPFGVSALPPDSPRKLFLIGLVTNLLNPKIALLYLALLPQFIDPAKGAVLGQTLALGGTQILIATVGDALFAFGAGAIAGFLTRRPGLGAHAALADGMRLWRPRDPDGVRRAALKRRRFVMPELDPGIHRFR